MQGYIKHSELTELYQIPIGTIRAGIQRNRKGTSTAWESIKGETDRRCVFVKVDSIPCATRQKYNIPLVSGYSNENRDPNEHYLNSLQDAFNFQYQKYISIYQKYFPNDREKVVKYARSHAVWSEVLHLTGGGDRAKRNTLKPVYQSFTKLDSKKKYRHYSHFSAMNSNIRKMGTDDRSISYCVLGGSYGVKRNYIASSFHNALAIFYLSQPNRYAYRVVADLINAHALEEGQGTISESWVKALMQDNFIKTLVSRKRYGKSRFNDLVDSYLPRHASPYPGNLWMIDGTPVQFWCRDENSRWVRAYLFVVLDVCTRKVVGYSVSKSEDRYMIIKSLKMAVELSGHLPTEILSDNFSANRTDELKAIQAEMQTLGCVWRHASVGNAQDKSYVERWVRTFQTTVCSMYDDYMGEGITSRDDNGLRDRDFILRVVKINGVPTFDEMKVRIAEMINIYNDLSLRGNPSPNSKYSSLPSPNARVLTAIDKALIFWKTREIKVSRSMVLMIVKKVKYHYTIKDHDLKLALNSETVKVRYDEHDLSQIMIFDYKTNDFIAELKQLAKVNVAQIDQTEVDEIRIFAAASKKKSFHKHIDNTMEEKVRTGLSEVGQELETFESKNPLELFKANRLSEEDRQMKEYFYMDEEINPMKVDSTYKPIEKNKSKINALEKQINLNQTAPFTGRVVNEAD